MLGDVPLPTRQWRDGNAPVCDSLSASAESHDLRCGLDVIYADERAECIGSSEHVIVIASHEPIRCIPNRGLQMDGISQRASTGRFAPTGGEYLGYGFELLGVGF